MSDVLNLPIIVMGDSGTGKTTFLKRCLNKLNKKDDEENKDEENTTTITYEKRNIIIELIDTSGDKNDKVETFSKLQKAEGIFLFYSVEQKQTLLSLVNWVDEIQYIKDIPIFIIGNKIDIEESKREINYEEAKVFINYLGAPFLECSALTGEKVKEIFEYFCIKLIKGSFYFEEQENKKKEEFIKKMSKINLNQMNYIICDNCLQVPFSEYVEQTGQIQIICQCNKQRRLYKKLEEIKCSVCNQIIEPKNLKESLYNFLDKLIVCKSCVKFYSNKKNNDKKLINFNCIDCICDKHGNLKRFYCKKCKHIHCIECQEKHFYYDTINDKFFNNFIDKIKEKVIEEEVKLKTIKVYVEELLRTIKQKVQFFLDKKQNEIKYKYEILELFNTLKYNQNLYATIKNFKFEKNEDISFNLNDDWKTQLEVIFNYINQPIKVRDYIINKNSINRDKLNILKNNDNSDDNSYKSKKINVTGGFKIDDNYFIISFDNGCLNLYNKNDLKNEENSIKLFGELQGISSLLKLNDIKNNYKIYASGYEKIKIVIYKNYIPQEIGIIFEPEVFFHSLNDFTINNSIIYATYDNQVVIYNLNDESKINIYNKIFYNQSNEILNIKSQGNNIFYLDVRKEENILVSERGMTLISEFPKNINPIKSTVIVLDKDNTITNQYYINEGKKILSFIDNDNLLLLGKEVVNYSVINLNLKDKKETTLLNFTELYDDILIFQKINQTDDFIHYLSIGCNFEIKQFIYKIKSNKIVSVIPIRKVNANKAYLVEEERVIADFNFDRDIYIILKSGDVYKISINI